MTIEKALKLTAYPVLSFGFSSKKFVMSNCLVKLNNLAREFQVMIGRAHTSLQADLGRFPVPYVLLR